MRACRFLAAIAAGLVSLSVASAAGGPASQGQTAADVSPSASPLTVAAAKPDTDPSNSATSPSPAPQSPPPERAPSQVSSGVSPKRPAATKALAPSLVVKINLSSQSMTLHYDGATREAWKISSGREGYATPRGVFRPQWASKMWYSRKYDDAPMPHSVFFVGGVAVHGTQATRMLGAPASHGCVRLAPANAARFYALVHKHGYARTRIEVFGSAPASRLATKRRERVLARETSPTPRRGYPQRMVSGSGGQFGWSVPKPAEQLQRGSNGLIYLSPNSPYRGRETFVYNGVVYRRVR
ncbi:MAG: L,D-transpeptidase [Hyphomicrobiaceae bacterium]